jgi:hypothetical protein
MNLSAGANLGLCENCRAVGRGRHGCRGALPKRKQRHFPESRASRELSARSIGSVPTNVPRVHHGGGSQPRWSHEGRQIFFVQPDRKLTAVSFDPNTGTAGPPRARPFSDTHRRCFSAHARYRMGRVPAPAVKRAFVRAKRYGRTRPLGLLPACP